MENPGKRTKGLYVIGLTIGALGVVYGDIGTSPLYALRECFHGIHPVSPSEENILGVLSLIFWSLMFIVSFKYMGFVMRANNKGEGGILALLSLAIPARAAKTKTGAILLAAGVFGAALLYGDGMITPAISVLSAVEGLGVATPLFEPYIIPITVAVLIALFSVQRSGTERVGRVFGPVMMLWFVSLAGFGLHGILQAPEVFAAVNPAYAVRFFVVAREHAFLVLGAVFLAVTGAEALYADMGHFGIRPIRMAWFWLVMPALLLNYLGQGAVLLREPAAVVHPFYYLAPRWAVYPLVALATLSTVIASQALISGAFSLTMQAIQLGYAPRLEIRHTSQLEKGQIYLPQINWALMLACIGLVLGFRSSSHLAAAYGIAVSLTMLITSLLFYFAARHLWNWPRWKAGLLSAAFLIPELAFFSANFLKIAHGGWFPLVMAVSIFTLMATWKTGRVLIREKLEATRLPFRLFLDDLKQTPVVRVPGTAVFLSANPRGTPIALLHNIKHNKVLHERVVVLTLVTDEVPHVHPAHRVEFEKLDRNFFRIVGHYGFMQEPSVPEVLQGCAEHGLEFKPMETTFFLSRETIIPTKMPGMALWRERLFAVMTRNAQRATTFFHLPPNRVVELGIQIEL